MPKLTEFETQRLLKRDLFGTVEAGLWLDGNGTRSRAVLRDTSTARWWTRWLARRLLVREQRALRALHDLAGTPVLLEASSQYLVRSWIEGRPLQLGGAPNVAWHSCARRLLAQMHRRGVAHNDLAKEPNLLVTPEQGVAVVDFQLATITRYRGLIFRSMAREDLRHLLKHKRWYHAQHLRAREQRLLARRGFVSRTWRVTGKPLYLFVTRRLFGWRDREGAGDRSTP